MRKFKLYNQDGVAKDITYTDAIFTDPAGLGTTLSPQFADLRQGFFKLVSDDIIPQGSIVGTLVFQPKLNTTAYARYKALADWLFKARELYFGYKPDNASDEYICRVKIDYLTKTEIKTGLCLEAPVAFKVMTPWFYSTPVTPTISTSTSSGAQIYKATITARGQLPAAFKVVTTGSAKIPRVISLRDHTTEEELEAASFYVNRPSVNLFEFSTLYEDSYARDVDGNDLVEYMSSAITEPFFHIPADRDYELWVLYNSGDTLPSSVSMTIYHYFRTV